MVNYAHFVKAEPPDRADLVRKLFVDREDEMRFAQEQVLSLIAESGRQIMAVTGLARTGKSHFLRQLSLDPAIRDEFGAVLYLRISQGSDARAVMRNTFQAFREWLITASADSKPGTKEAQAWNAILTPLSGINNTYAPAIEGNESIQLTHKSLRTTSTRIQQQLQVDGKVNLKVASLLANVMGVVPEAQLSMGGQKISDSQDASGNESTYQVTVQPFSAERLRRLIALTHLLVREKTRELAIEWRTLLVIDDFDLLARKPDGSLDPLPLQTELYELAQLDGFYVMTTVRQDTYIANDKNFHRIADIGPFRDAALYRAIYERHVREYYDGEDPFAEQFVGMAADRCQGRVGLFLEQLRGAYTEFRTKRWGGSEELRNRDYLGYMQQHWEYILRNAPEEAQILQEVCARDERCLLRADEAAKVRQSIARDCILEDYSSVNHVIIKPHIAAYLRERAQTPQTKEP